MTRGTPQGARDAAQQPAARSPKGPCKMFRADSGFHPCLECGWSLHDHIYEMDTDTLTRVLAGEIDPQGRPRKRKEYDPAEVSKEYYEVSTSGGPGIDRTGWPSAPRRDESFPERDESRQG